MKETTYILFIQSVAEFLYRWSLQLVHRESSESSRTTHKTRKGLKSKFSGKRVNM